MNPPRQNSQKKIPTSTSAGTVANSLGTSITRLMKKTPSDPMHLISLGAGVQSSVMALMAAAGEITPMPMGAIFADTKAEPQNVYTWLDWLETRLPFPVFRVSKGDLAKVATHVRTSKAGNNYTKSAIPAFIVDGHGKQGLLMRQCTSDFKIEVIQREIRRLRPNKQTQVIQWIGISQDEWLRAKPSRLSYVTNTFPLLERKMDRKACLEWMKARSFPIPPRSACVFCPYHSDKEWLRLKTEDPESFERAVKFEGEYQQSMARVSQFRGTPWLHRSHRPLAEVDFSEKENPQYQFDTFLSECQGMCGL